jgi:SWI/SNF-related matrix-associated actin-dependent regulator of chromatin subfamily A3
MEPQWNPTLEEQALARIHRLGQTKKVTTTRFIMKDSIEEVCMTPISTLQLLKNYKHVVNVQNRKKSLADLLLSQEQLSMSDVNRTRLQQLRSLLG